MQRLVDLKDKYLNQYVWLVCGGPSVRGFDFSRLKGTVAALNEIGVDVPNLDLWIGHDNLKGFPPEFWQRDCLKFLATGRRHTELGVEYPVHSLVEFKQVRHKYEDRRPYLRVEQFFAGDGVVWQAPYWEHGGYAHKKSAMLMSYGILYRLGFREIRLLGCDWGMTLENSYGHDRKSVDEFQVRKSGEQFRAMDQWHGLLLPYFRCMGLKVYNCTDGGRLEVFERKDWREFCAGTRPD